MNAAAPAGEVGVELYRLGPSDTDLVHGLEQEVFPEDPWTRAMIAEELASPLRFYVGARVGERTLGWAGIRLGSDADVMTIGVLPEARRRGVAAALVAEILAVARAAGVERVFLEVRASNAPAQRLYERAGFTHIGRVRGYYRNPTEDAVTMRLDLKA